ARKVAQPLHAQQFERGWHRPIETEADLRRRRLREGVGHLEDAVGDRELAARRYVDVAAADIDHGRATGNVQVDVGIADGRQAFDRAHFAAVPGELDQ